MTTKRQQTMAKMTRERNVREKRERKAEKKAAAAAERARLAEEGVASSGPPIGPTEVTHDEEGAVVANQE
jgi:hypothetical protein